MSKVLVVCAPGGHLSVARELAEDLGDCEFAITSSSPIPHPLSDHYVREANRDMAVIAQFVDAFRVLKKSRPAIIVSTGAGVAVSFFLIGKFFYGAKLVFVESASRVHTLSFTGRLLYFVADKFYVRSESLSSKYSKATYCG